MKCGFWRNGVLGLCAGLSMITAGAAHAGLEQEPEIQAFIAEMQAKHDLKGMDLNALFAQAEMLPAVIEAMERPAEGKPWYVYRPIFLTEQRVQLGVQFWQQHADTFAKASKKYGVAEEIILAIIGVETRYGARTGNFRVLDSLATLAFYYPKRAPFFRSQLEDFILLVQEEGLDPLQMRGSYAGAVGMPQFIPSSYRHYAVDFDGDGKRDLMNSPADAIGSVANYFRQHGWVAGDPVVAAARVSGEYYPDLLALGLKPAIPAGVMAQYGIETVAALPGQGHAALLEFQQEQGMEYWLGYNNFYVITRYNRSPLYAMAVYQLSLELRGLKEQPLDPTLY